MTDTNKRSILSKFMDQVWNNGALDMVEQFVAPQYTIKHDPGDRWDGQTIDHAEFKERVMFTRNAIPDVCFDIREMIEEHDRIVAFWMMSGTQRGDLPGLPATDKPFAISGITIYDFEGDKVCGHIQAYDRLGFLAQIGFMG